ncbi:hypothetical protein DVH05_017804 [Phytophthora capsici]|nr:hypothetical protein DVH05_017804 [Phytophthora capsici]
MEVPPGIQTRDERHRAAAIAYGKNQAHKVQCDLWTTLQHTTTTGGGGTTTTGGGHVYPGGYVYGAHRGAHSGSGTYKKKKKCNRFTNWFKRLFNKDIKKCPKKGEEEYE